jgi:hypothetical protein
LPVQVPGSLTEAQRRRASRQARTLRCLALGELVDVARVYDELIWLKSQGYGKRNDS